MNSASRKRQQAPPQWIEPPPVPSEGGRCSGLAVPSGPSTHGSESGLLAVAFAPSHRIGAHVRHDRAARVVADLVELELEVVVRIVRSLVHADDTDAVLREFRRYDRAGGAGANDDHVDFAFLGHDHPRPLLVKTALSGGDFSSRRKSSRVRIGNCLPS